MSEQTAVALPVVERTISAIFAEEQQIDGVVRRLIERGIDKEHISVPSPSKLLGRKSTSDLMKMKTVFGRKRKWSFSRSIDTFESATGQLSRSIESRSTL
jgi:hypothetical protein